MYRIIDSRGSGKTSHLMLLAKENNAVFVCSNKRAMEEKAHAYGIVGINFMDYYDFLNSRGKRINNYVIDELETFTKYMVNDNMNIDHNKCLIGYTLSNED